MKAFFLFFLSSSQLDVVGLDLCNISHFNGKRVRMARVWWRLRYQKVESQGIPTRTCDCVCVSPIKNFFCVFN